ncbi:MAG: hypothetical protein IPN76_05060 [Saprospiraceae bacterium]|nr:hypothetical protein [Saprospiraceae bacterium]
MFYFPNSNATCAASLALFGIRSMFDLRRSPASQGIYVWMANLAFREGFWQLLAGEVMVIRA